MQASIDSVEPLIAGSRLDRYELLCPLAAGGMATVWLARMRGKHGFEKIVAIKTIKPEFNDDPRFEEMFLDEARIASGIQHPNVAQIIDLGEQRDILYLVMEWVDGESLAKLRREALKRERQIPIDISLRIIADVCAGLHAAHELRDAQGNNLGVVHRDVSPQNILISTQGGVKVIDFGVAKAKNRASGETNAGVFKGKLQYAAPEQALGYEIDRRVDIWAVGACLYELLSGRLPIEGENQLERLSRLTSGAPLPPLDSNLPSSVREVVGHSLMHDRDRRFSTAAAMQRAIEGVLAELRLTTTSEDVAAYANKFLSERTRHRRRAVAAALEAASAREGKAASTSGAFRLLTDMVGDDGVGAGSGSLGNLVDATPGGLVETQATLASAALTRTRDAHERRGGSRRGVWLSAGLFVAAAGVSTLIFAGKHARNRTAASAPPTALTDKAESDSVTKHSPAVTTNAVPSPSAAPVVAMQLPPASSSAEQGEPAKRVRPTAPPPPASWRKLAVPIATVLTAAHSPAIPVAVSATAAAPPVPVVPPTVDTAGKDGF